MSDSHRSIGGPAVAEEPLRDSAALEVSAVSGVSPLALSTNEVAAESRCDSGCFEQLLRRSQPRGPRRCWRSRLLPALSLRRARGVPARRAKRKFWPPCSSSRHQPGEESIKVYCHLCGATLRDPEQYQRLSGPTQRDAVYVCRDERRCQRRAARDPLTGMPYPSGTQAHDPLAHLPAEGSPRTASRRR